MSNKKTENTPSGSPIYKYEARTKPFEAAIDSPDIERIEEHVEKYIGKAETVFHEIVSDLVHIDIFFIKPTPNRNFNTLITSGMSHRPMKAPPKFKNFQYSELMICLPPEWPLTDGAMKDEKYYWPIRQLKMLARFPHEYDTWLWNGHTVPNDDPPRPFAGNTKLSGIIVTPPLLSPKEFFTLKIDETKTIHFFSILPLYTDEMNFKLKKGSDDLFERLDKQGVNELLNIRRPNVCKNSWWPF
jgi:hypothetical protein